MKNIIFVSVISTIATISWAKEAALVCVFMPTGERFNIFSIDGADYIQLGMEKYGIISKFDHPYLTVTLYGHMGKFRMVYNAPIGIGYADIEKSDGQRIEGKTLCSRS